MCSFKLALYATARAQNGAPKRVLNDPREREALGKTTEASRGGLPPVHAAVRLDGGHVATKPRKVNRMLRAPVIF
jgi:hypothetical protein